MWIINSGSIGDHVALTPVIEALREKHPDEPLLVDGRFADAVFRFNPHYGGDGKHTLPTVTVNPLWQPYDVLGPMPVSFGVQCGVDVQNRAPRLYLSAAEKRVGKRVVGRSHPVVAVDVWARWHSRRWPMGRFIEALELLRKDGWVVAEVGSLVYDQAGALPERLPNADIRAFGLYSLRQTMAVIGACDVFLGNDSGLFHVAAAMGVPQVVVFGAKPWYSRAYWNTTPLYSLAPCEPHCLAVCHRLNRCIEDVTPKQAAEAVGLALRRYGRAKADF